MSYSEVELDEADQAKLRKLTEAQQGLNNFIQSMMKAGETRAAALQGEGQQIWSEIAKKHGLDLDRVNYTVSKDGKKLVPVMVRLADA